VVDNAPLLDNPSGSAHDGHSYAINRELTDLN
jgi:hypothetical protein